MARAAELFAERRIAATSVDEVLAAAGTSWAAAVGFRCAQVIAGADTGPGRRVVTGGVSGRNEEARVRVAVEAGLAPVRTWAS